MGVITHLENQLSVLHSRMQIPQLHDGIYLRLYANESHPTSRCQTTPSIGSLEDDQPVIPAVPFYSLSGDLFHTESPDHYNRLSSLFDLSILQSSKYLLLRLKIGDNQFKLTFVCLRYFLGGDRPSQTTHYTCSLNKKLEIKNFKSGISFFV